MLPEQVKWVKEKLSTIELNNNSMIFGINSLIMIEKTDKNDTRTTTIK
jgi:hypothetical protein